MTDQTGQTDIVYKDPSLEEITTSRVNISEGEDEDVRNVGFERLEVAIEKTEDAEVVSNIILTAIKTKETLTRDDRYRSEKRDGDILRLGGLLEEAIQKECFLKASGVAEECIKQAIINTEYVSIDPKIWDILETLYDRKEKETSSREGTRGEQFILDILDKKSPREVSHHILGGLSREKFFYKRPEFVLSVFKQILENVDSVEKKEFIRDLTQSDLFFAKPELAKKVINILLDNGLVKEIKVNYLKL